MKNKKAFALLLTANAISGFAQGISIIAIPWYFISVLNKSSAFGIMYAAVTFITLFWSLYAGTLIDKYSRKKIFLSVNILGGIVLGSVAGIGWYFGKVPTWSVMLVFASTIFIFNIHYPSLYAFGQEITEKEKYAKMNSSLEIQLQATTMISGALAAVLLSGTKNQIVNIFGFVVHLSADIQKWELHEIFAMNAATYFIAVVLILFIRYKPALEKIIDTGTIWERTVTGFRFFKEHPLVFLFGNASYAIFVVILVEANQLAPLYIDQHLKEDASVYASASMYYALGALFSGFVITRIFKNIHSLQMIILMMFITVAGCYICSFSRSILMFYLFSLLIGVTNAGTRILRITYLFHHIPNHLIGRTSSMFNMINIFFRTLLIGLFSVPFFIQSNHVIYSYFICGTFVLVWIVPMVLKYTKLKN
ncbi:MAG: MFS transporter [Bacteroidota bacterium]